MKYGFVLPMGDAGTAAEFAYLAEQAGWDGFFVYETLWGVDAWVSLTASAMRTTRIKLGTMISPLSRMRPWKIASEAATLDQLCQGRVIISVGLGAAETGFEAFHEETDRKIRAERLDESLAIITALWAGKPLKFEGKHFQVDTSRIAWGYPPAIRPYQDTGIPIWVVGAWPSVKSMSRAARWNGLLPNILGSSGHAELAQPDVETIKQMREFIFEKRGSLEGYDIIHEEDNSTPPGKAASQTEYAEAGVTWWLTSLWSEQNLDRVKDIVVKGPPK
jgi:alkanesulfonate monooxygenase SsuD/methylene tetrahydromethanopterin reductase-like flavin-dependent oxidoreductase (luciferase family)